MTRHIGQRWSILAAVALICVLAAVVGCGSTTTTGPAATTATTAGQTTTTVAATTNTTATVTTVTTAAGGKQLIIGASLPLSGGFALYGKEVQSGIQMAVDEANAAGGVGGQQVKVVFEDSAGDPKQAVTAVQKLIEVDKVQANIGTINSSEALATNPIAERAKVISISSMVNHPKATDAGPHTFMLRGPVESDVGVLVKWATEKKGLKKFAFVASDGDWARACLVALTTFAGSNGAEVVSSEFYPSGTKDWKTILTKANTKGPDSIFIFGSPPDIAQILRQMAELGIKLPVYGSDMMRDASIMKTVGTLLEGATYSRFVPATDAGKTFVADFLTKYQSSHAGAAPSTLTVFAGYDSAHLVIAAAQAVGVDTDKMAAWIAGVKDFLGAQGEITFNAKRQVSAPRYIEYVEGGKYVTTDFNGQ
jgi:branched-chain amino acid transport system substrate-binding protein